MKTCTATPDCKRPHYAKVACRTHYGQRLQGKSYTPIRERSSMTAWGIVTVRIPV